MLYVIQNIFKYHLHHTDTWLVLFKFSDHLINVSFTTLNLFEVFKVYALIGNLIFLPIAGNLLK